MSPDGTLSDIPHLKLMPKPATAQAAEADKNRALNVLTAGTARMAATTGLRQVLSLVVLAFTAAIVARFLGPRNFGLFSGGTAAFNLFGGLLDLGFSLVLVRELSTRTQDEDRLMGTAVVAQTIWGLALTVALIVMGIASSGTRGDVMLVLSPALLFSGLGVSRQIFSVRFRASPLLIVDVTTNVAQSLITIGLALIHASVLLIAANIGTWSLITGVVCLWLARKLVAFSRPRREEVIRFIRTAFPLGFAGLLATLYFTIDLTLLGWLVTPQRLGQYAAATRVLTVVVSAPGYVMAAGIPGLSQHRGDRAGLSSFAGILTHWIAAVALPIGVGVAIFARPAVLILFGAPYLSAVPLIHILMIAALLSFASNVTGIILASQSIVLVQLIFNTISLVINVGGNILLVPRYGVVASAWLTVASEAIVLSYGLYFVRSVVDLRTVAAHVVRPLLATALAGAAGVILGPGHLWTLFPSAIVFLIAMTLLRGWPHVLTDWVRSRWITG